MINMIEIGNKRENEIINILRERNNKVSNEVKNNVKNIIKDVRDNGDIALKRYTLNFDKVNLNSFIVSNKEIEGAFEEADKKFIDVLEESKNNIKEYHLNQKQRGYLYQKELGVYMGQRIIPIDRVGVYVPGGKAAYPSSVLMNVIPAHVAGVKEIVIVTPPDIHGNVNKNILVAAKICGINKIYKVGGAQAIAALAYGTESIKRVSMIVGPGNLYVAEAKRQVYGDVGIDMVAGPSEILIIADKNNSPKYIAADLMSQAEHDEMASSILLTTSKELAVDVQREIEIQINNLSRKEIIEKSLSKYGKIIICNDINQCIELANKISPEHLEILLNNPLEYLEKIKNAGSIFLGEYTPEPVGDYFGGTNHVLPTSGSAKFSSPLSVDTFMKKSSFLYYSKKALERDRDKIIYFAEKEGLTAHGNSVKVRLYEED